MMKLLAVAPVLGIPVLAETAGSLDIGTMLASYGIAAPFAGLCWWQMNRSQKQLDEARDEIRALQAAALLRERELIGSVAPMFYDAARLYEGANRKLTQAAAPSSPMPSSDVETLARGVQELIARLDERR